MFKLFQRSSAKRAFLIAVGILLVYLFSIRPLNPFETFQLKMHDFLFLSSLRFKESPPELKEIILVVLDDESFTKVNQRWPWDRSIYAELVDKLSAQKPRLILLDVTFVGESHAPESDTRLAASLEKAGNVMIAHYLGDFGEAVLPLEKIRKASLAYGHVNKPLDNDYSVRRAQACQLTLDGKVVETAVEVKAAASLFGGELSPQASPFLYFQKKEGAGSGSSFRGSKFPIPVGKDGTLFLNYQARQEDFSTLPAWEILSDKVPPQTLKDKIVLFGLTSRIMHDIHNTPFGPLPGVYIFANFLLMLLSGAYVKSAPLWIDLLIFFVTGLLTAHAAYRFSLWRGFLFLFYEVVLLLGGTFLLYVNNIHWDFSSSLFGIFFSYLGITFYKYLQILFENVSLREEAITDGLTQLYTYRYFELRLRNEFERSKRYKTSLSLVFLDIDHFKKINDTYGHEEGNLVLKTIAQILKKNTRRIDLVARYGGEEFCVVLPQTDLEGARLYADNIRRAVENTPFFLLGTESVKVTVSAGVSTYPTLEVPSSEEFVKVTDHALYEAKQSGRNRVCVGKAASPV